MIIVTLAGFAALMAWNIWLTRRVLDLRDENGQLYNLLSRASAPMTRPHLPPGFQAVEPDQPHTHTVLRPVR